MTIPYEIIIGQDISEKDTAAIRQLLASTFNEVDAIYNKWNPQSEVAHLNKLPANEPMVLSHKLMSFLLKTAAFVALDPRFDPTVEALQRRWVDCLQRNTLPGHEELNELQASVGWDNLVFNGSTVSKKHSQTSIDLGSIAKGHLVDLLTERLASLGITNAYVEWGGEIRTSGSHPDGRPWIIGIPIIDISNECRKDSALRTVKLANRAIATSGDYLQNWTVKNRRYTHIVDRKTLSLKEISETSIATATVIAPECMTADALATMLFLCDSIDEAKKLITILKSHYLDTDYFLMARDGTSYSTSAFRS